MERRHTPPDVGGVDATSRRSREASFNGAGGVVENGTSSKERILKHFVNPNHPSAPLEWLRIFFLMAQPPLLYPERNCQPDFHSQLHRRRLQKRVAPLYTHRKLCILQPNPPSLSIDQSPDPAWAVVLKLQGQRCSRKVLVGNRPPKPEDCSRCNQCRSIVGRRRIWATAQHRRTSFNSAGNLAVSRIVAVNDPSEMMGDGPHLFR
jgi:hypothetical protein